MHAFSGYMGLVVTDPEMSLVWRARSGFCLAKSVRSWRLDAADASVARLQTRLGDFGRLSLHAVAWVAWIGLVLLVGWLRQSQQ